MLLQGMGLRSPELGGIPGGSITRARAPGPSHAAMCKILTPLNLLLQLLITPGVFEVTGWKKQHFKGKKQVFPENE